MNDTHLQKKGFWKDYPGSLEAMMHEYVQGRSHDQIAEALAVKFDAYVTRGMVQKKMSRVVLPPRAEGVPSPQSGLPKFSSVPRSFWGRNITAYGVAKEMVRAGKSASEVSDVLSRTYGESVNRNAVIGKFRRMCRGMRGESPPIPVRPRTKKVEPVRDTIVYISRGPSRVRQDPLPLRVIAIPPDARCVPIWDLPNSLACRWIVAGDPQEVEEVRYCAAPAEEGRSYCDYHRRIGEQPRKPPSHVPLKLWR